MGDWKLSIFVRCVPMGADRVRPAASSDRRPRDVEALVSANATQAKRKTPVVLALNVQDACAALGISWRTWADHVQPEIKLVRFGTAKRVPVSELQRYLDEHAELVLEEEG